LAQLRTACLQNLQENFRLSVGTWISVPKSRLGKGNRDYAIQVISPAFEKRMLFDIRNNVEIAMRTAVNTRLTKYREANASFVFDSRRDFGINRLLLNVAAFPFALGAGVTNHGAGALAGWTRARHTEEALLISDLPTPSATATGGGRFAPRAARTLAGVAILMPVVRNLGLGAEYRLLELDSDVREDRLLAARVRRRPPPPPKMSLKPKNSPNMSLKS
jgi:hypothetical protein